MTILRAAAIPVTLLSLLLLATAGCTQPDATTASNATDEPIGIAPAEPDEVAEPPPAPPPEANPNPDDPTSQNERPMTDNSDQPALETATFAGGCFWCIEAVLDRIDGVSDVKSGYMGGDVDNPTYRAVCDGVTGHAEVVQFRFDPKVTSYEKLVGYFFVMHDPTTLNRQGNDVGTQYRSAIFYHSDAQKQTAERVIAKINPKFDNGIVTEVTAASTFWPAEDYHQDYWAKNPSDGYCNAFIPSKLEKLGLER